jgi:hypothetical protein
VTKFSADTLTRHAREVAGAFGIQLVLDPSLKPEDAGAAVRPDCPAGSIVIAAPIVDETTYAVVLHELGHILHPGGVVRSAATAKSLGLKQHEEEAAWSWARHNALEWTAVMETVATWALSTYYPTPTPTPTTPTARPTVRVNSDVAAFARSVKWSK